MSVVDAAKSEAFDAHAPLLIVGAGAAGLNAALAAKEAGVDPVVVERDATPSGSTALSAGLIPTAGTHSYPMLLERDFDTEAVVVAMVIGHAQLAGRIAILGVCVTRVDPCDRLDHRAGLPPCPLGARDGATELSADRGRCWSVRRRERNHDHCARLGRTRNADARGVRRRQWRACRSRYAGAGACASWCRDVVGRDWLVRRRPLGDHR